MRRGFKELKKKTTHATFVQGNVTIWEDQLKCFKTAISKYKKIDVVMANAGRNSADPVFHMDDPSGDPKKPDLLTVEVDLNAVLYTTKLAYHYFGADEESKKRDRVLILTSSVAGYVDQPGSPQYAAAKYGVRAIMRSLRRTSLRDNVRINVIAPWYMATPMHAPATKKHFIDVGCEDVSLEDAVVGLGRIIVDNSINGRGVAFVPRSFSPSGYCDAEMDDFKTEKFGLTFQKEMLRASHRVSVPLDAQKMP